MSAFVVTRPAISSTRKGFSIFAWAVLLYNIPVILWGAYVRVSFSGDGCGANWPFCNGQVLPRNMSAPTVIEFTHRLMTSLDSCLVIGLAAWAFYAFPKQHAVRRFAVWSLGFLLVEALLGAGLVLFRKVAHDQSSGRAIYLSAHLVNTLLLLGVLTITAWAAQRNRERILTTQISSRIITALALVLLVSVTGAVAALGDMLFPVSTLAGGLQQDFRSGGSPLLHLRFLHPLLAIAGAGYILAIAISKLRGTQMEAARAAAGHVIVLVTIQLAAGALNFSLLAPIWMQLVHLLIADILWIATLVWALEDQNSHGILKPFGLR